MIINFDTQQGLVQFLIPSPLWSQPVFFFGDFLQTGENLVFIGVLGIGKFNNDSCTMAQARLVLIK